MSTTLQTTALTINDAIDKAIKELLQKHTLTLENYTKQGYEICVDYKQSTTIEKGVTATIRLVKVVETSRVAVKIKLFN